MKEETILGKANEAQRKIITEMDRNLLLIASAGTGKTDSIARRVSWILYKGYARGEQVLCMTFTNKACREMKERILTLAGKEGHKVDVLTFHSFCYKVLLEEGKKEDSLYGDTHIFDEEDCRELYADIKPKGMSDYAFQGWLSLMKESRSLYGYYSGKEEEDIAQTVERVYRDRTNQVQALFSNPRGSIDESQYEAMKLQGGQVLLRYNARLAALQGLDFVDLIVKVYELFRREDVRARWKQRYSFICVDEMQDTGDLEYAVMKMLWSGNRVLLCGDYFQTIYEWRGSNPRAILADYRQLFSPETVVFYENYRANKTLFEATFKTLLKMFPEEVGEVYESLPVSASSEEGKSLGLFEATDPWGEGAFIFSCFENKRKEERGKSAVLVRNNMQARQLSEMFSLFNEKKREEDRIDFMVIEESKFFRRQEIKDVLSYFKLAVNPQDSISAKRIIRRFVPGIGEARIRTLDGVETRKAGLRLTDFLDYRIFEQEPYEALIEALEEGRVIVFDVESTGINPLEDEIIQIAAFRITKEGEILERFERFIKPSKPVGQSEDVHGFSDAFLEERGESARTVLEAFQSFTKNAVVVGHNVQYDATIFGAELHRNGLGRDGFAAVYDTLDMFRRFYPRLENHKLGYLSEVFETKHKPSHNAMDDILATAELLVRIVRKNIVDTADERRKLILQYKSAFGELAASMATLRRKSKTEKPKDVLAYIMKEMGVLNHYERRGEQGRIAHIRDLYLLLKSYEEEQIELAGDDAVKQVLQWAALTSGEADPRIKNRQRIPIITIHQAKGSEFDFVYLAGLNEGVFPSHLAMREGTWEEEKRLFYVALTRAKKELIITYAKRDRYDREIKVSSLLGYLPEEHVEKLYMG